MLAKLEQQEVVIIELGTPQIFETEEVNELVELGPEIVPYLIELLGSESPKKVAYIVLILGNIRDKRALEPLQKLRAEYQSLEHKTEWNYAVIGQCNTAIATLEQNNNTTSNGGCLLPLLVVLALVDTFHSSTREG